jgi:hypothetical protein
MRTPVRGRKVLVPGWSGREPRGRRFGDEEPWQRGDLKTDQADTGSRKDWARRWDGLEADCVDTGCAEKSAWQQDGLETDQVNAGSRKDGSKVGWSGSAPRGRRFEEGEPRQRGDLETNQADVRCGEGQGSGMGRSGGESRGHEVRGRIGPATGRLENGSNGRRFAEGLSRQRDGSETN